MVLLRYKVKLQLNKKVKINKIWTWDISSIVKIIKNSKTEIIAKKKIGDYEN